MNGISRAIAMAFLLTSLSGLMGAEPELNKEAARKYIDARAKEWLQWQPAIRRGGGGTKCISCHTAVPIALAQSVLGDSTPAEKALMSNVKSRSAKWADIVAWNGDEEKIRHFYGDDKKDESLDTESVLYALLLVNHDTTRRAGLSQASKDALKHLWSRQNGNGSWDWLDFGLRPWELDARYYGTALAAVAVGKAGKDYRMQLGEEEKEKLDQLKKYLRDNYGSEPLHNRLGALWASTLLPGILTEQQQKDLIQEVLNIDRNGDGWSFASLGKKATNNATWRVEQKIPANSKYDGYATAFIVHVLRSSQAEGDKLKRARKWLIENKVAQGKGPVMYPNPDRERDPDTMIGKFMRDAAAAYAILGLKAIE